MTESPISDAELYRESERIADKVWSERVELPTGESGWFGFDSTGEKPALKVRKGIHSGQLGVGLFFAAMYHASGDERYRNYAREPTAYLVEEDIDSLLDGLGHGLGSGVGSVAYGLSVIGELTGESRYAERAARLSARFSLDEADEGPHGLLTGTAGSAVGFLRAYEQSGDREALDRAVECGERLLERRSERDGREVWVSDSEGTDPSVRTGIGYGHGGIGYSLYRLSHHADRPEFRDAAADAVAFEDTFYSPSEGNWRSPHPSAPEFSSRWVSGITGVGLSRLASLDYHESPDLERGLRRAEEGLDRRLSSWDSLYYGSFSKIGLLTELGRTDEERAEEARLLAAKAVERRRERGEYRVPYSDVEGLYNPTFFLGTSGIGYQLLRLLYPEELPSVLRFE